MFTAKAQVDDKISGYESGADDYLTKPIHPAELTAHLKALLSRSKSRASVSTDRGYMIGVLAAKGGVGVSTVALNLAIAFHQKTKAEVIAAELRPGQGTWSVELNSQNADGLTSLLRRPAGEVSAVAVEDTLVRMPYGVRLLMASPSTKDTEWMRATDQLNAVVENLPLLARLVMLDIGTNFLPGIDTVLAQCNEVILVTEPFPACAQRTRLMIEDLNARGFGRSKLLTLVSVNRIRADVQLSMSQMQELLGIPVAQIFPPAPEIAFQAASRSVPLVQVQIGGVISQQFSNMAEKLTQRVPV
jgi:pilus assembly protein CpaE